MGVRGETLGIRICYIGNNCFDRVPIDRPRTWGWSTACFFVCRIRQPDRFRSISWQSDVVPKSTVSRACVIRPYLDWHLEMSVRQQAIRQGFLQPSKALPE